MKKILLCYFLPKKQVYLCSSTGLNDHLQLYLWKKQLRCLLKLMNQPRRKDKNTNKLFSYKIKTANLTILKCDAKLSMTHNELHSSLKSSQSRLVLFCHVVRPQLKPLSFVHPAALSVICRLSLHCGHDCYRWKT